MGKVTYLGADDQDHAFESRCVYFVHARPHYRANGKKSSVIYIGSTEEGGRLDGWLWDPNSHNAAYTLLWWYECMGHLIHNKPVKTPTPSKLSKASERQAWWKQNVVPNLTLAVLDVSESAKDLREIETIALHGFWMEYGELPVLNSQVPMRFDYTPSSHILTRNWNALSEIPKRLKRAA